MFLLCLAHLGSRVVLISWEEPGSVPSVPVILSHLTVQEGLACRSSLNIWENSVENPSVLGHVLSGKPFYHYFCLFICYGSV